MTRLTHRATRRLLLTFGVAAMAIAAPGSLLLAQSSIPAPGPCSTSSSNNASCRLHQVITTSIVQIRALTVTPGPDFSLTPITGELSAADYDAGFFDTSGSLTIRASASAAWRVSIQASSAALTGACSSKSASTIRWGLSAGARTNALSTSPVTIMSSSTFAINQSVSVFFRVGLNWLTDSPVEEANCRLPVTFTISAP